jgi:hypothetical protein
VRTPFVIAAALAATLLSIGTGTANAAETVPGCASAKQIGTTGYITYQGKNIGSVKQFAGCGKNYPYLWVWDSYFNAHPNVHVSNWIAEFSDGEEIPHGGGEATGRQELWGKGADTLDKCTKAVATIRTGSGVTDYVWGATVKRC